MKKIFFLFAALMAVVAVNAKVVELTPSDFSAVTSAATSATVDGVTAAVTTGTITADQIRIFTNQTITISCKSPISAIEFYCVASADYQYGPGCFVAQEGYSYAGTIGTWIGEATTSLAFTASKYQVHATKIKVYLDGETPAAKEIQMVNVAEAIAAGMALDSMATSELSYAVTGYVVNSQPYSLKYGNQIWFMADNAENIGEQEFEAYACLVKENGETLQVIDGDKVTLTGALKKYYDAVNSKYIIEIKNSTAEFVEKAEGDHSLLTPEELDTISAAEAKARCEALPVDGTERVAVLCLIASIKTPYDATYGNVTVWLNDDPESNYGDIMAYRANCSAEDGAVLAPHDKVLVIGNLSHTTYEVGGETKHSYMIERGAKLERMEGVKYSISVTCDTETGSVEGPQGEFEYGTELTYTATPKYGYHFVQWSDGVTANPRTIVITQDTMFTAFFEDEIVMPEAQVWPIIMDYQTSEDYQQNVVSDFRPNDVDNNFWIWNTTYSTGYQMGFNSNCNTEGYLALVVGDAGWSGLEFHIENTASTAAMQRLKDSIVANPDNYFLHIAIKSTDNYSHCFYIFGQESSRFILGSTSIYEGITLSVMANGTNSTFLCHYLHKF